jgi:lipopolysaccharide export system permease protein
MGILFVALFHNFSSSLKNIYLELKSSYTSDDKYLAVITNNGLWIKDKIDGKTLIINSNKIENNFLVETFISEFDDDFKNIRNIQSDKVNIQNNEWVIKNAKVYKENISSEIKNLKIKSNFNYERIQTLFSNLSSLSILELLDLKKNYGLLGYSTVKVDVHLHKLSSYPIYFILIVIFSSIIMFNSKNYKSTGFKIIIGLFSSVVIYYVNNFFYVLGNTERVTIIVAIWLPLLILSFVNMYMIRNINDK